VLKSLAIYLNDSNEYFFYKILKLFFKGTPIDNDNKVLFVSLSGLGDLILAHLILNNINSKKVYLLFSAEHESIFINYSGDVNLIPIHRKKYKFNPIYKILILRKIANLNISTSINMNRSRCLLDDQLTLISGKNNKLALSFQPKHFRNYFRKKIEMEYTSILFNDSESEYHKIVSLVNILGYPLTQKSPKLYYPLEVFSIHENQKVVIINPFSSYPFREWSLANYLEIVNWMCENYNYKVILVGKNRFSKTIKFQNVNFVNMIHKFALNEIVPLMNNASLFIGNDSGLAHIAKSLCIPRIIIAGGGSHGHYFPYLDGTNEILLYNYLDCFGCEWACKYKQPYCLTEVSIDSVKKSIVALLHI